MPLHVQELAIILSSISGMPYQPVLFDGYQVPEGFEVNVLDLTQQCTHPILLELGIMPLSSKESTFGQIAFASNCGLPGRRSTHFTYLRDMNSLTSP